MKSKVYNVKTVEQAQELMKKREDKTKKLHADIDKVEAKIAVLRKEVGALWEQVSSLPSYALEIQFCEQFKADAFGTDAKGNKLLRKDGKWFMVKVDDGKFKLEEIK